MPNGNISTSALSTTLQLEHMLHSMLPSLKHKPLSATLQLEHMIHNMLPSLKHKAISINTTTINNYINYKWSMNYYGYPTSILQYYIPSILSEPTTSLPVSVLVTVYVKFPVTFPATVILLR